MTSEMGLFEAGASEGAHACRLIIRGELAIEAYLTPQTSHEGSWCQASIALPNQKVAPAA